MAGARWEITVDGRARSYRDVREIAIEAARFLKSRHPLSKITVRDLDGGEAEIEIISSRP